MFLTAFTSRVNFSSRGRSDSKWSNLSAWVCDEWPSSSIKRHVPYQCWNEHYSLYYLLRWRRCNAWLTPHIYHIVITQHVPTIRAHDNHLSQTKHTHAITRENFHKSRSPTSAQSNSTTTMSAPSVGQLHSAKRNQIKCAHFLSSWNPEAVQEKC